MLKLNSDNIIHLTHTDLDGISCRVLISKLCDKSSRNYHPIHVDYSDITDKFINTLFEDINAGVYGDNISMIITDLNLSVSQSQLIDNYISNTNHLINLSLYDHHDTGSESAVRFPDWYHLDTSKSSTLIVFDTIVEPTTLLDINEKLLYSIFSMFVNAYDMYLRESYIEFQIGHYLNACLYNKLADVPSIFNTDKYQYASLFLNEVINSDMTTLYHAYSSYKSNVTLGTYVLDNILDKTLSTFTRKFLLANNIEHISSHQGMAMYLENKFNTSKFPILQYDDYKLLVTWDLPAKTLKPIFDIQMYEQNKYDGYVVIDTNLGSASMYSKNNTALDVSKIAKTFGGGGHVHAAGCMCAVLQVFNLDDTNKYTYFSDLLAVENIQYL